MNRDDIKAVILETLSAIAPDADIDGLPGDAELREELDLDSMDFLKLVTGLHERFQVDIPEVEYGRLATLDEGVHYLEGKLSG